MSDPELTTGDILRASKHSLRSSWIEMLCFSLLFQGVSFAILAPASNWVFTRLIAASGKIALGNEHIVEFVLSPLGILTGLLTAGVLLGIAYAQHAGLVWIAAADLHGRPATALAALRQIGSHWHRLLVVGLRQAAILAALLAPLAAAGGLVYVLLTRDYDIYYLINRQPPIFWIGGGIIAALAALGAALFVMLRVRWEFTVPLLMLDGLRPRACLRESRELGRGIGRTIITVIVGWLAIVAAVSFLGLQSIELLGQAAFMMTGGSLSVAIPVIGLLVLVGLLFAGAMTFIGFAGDAALSVELYRRTRRGQAHDAVAAPPSHAGAVRLVVFAVAAAISGVGLWSAVAETGDFDRPLVVTAHRGSSAAAPENTLAAVRLAIEQGADYAEIDVQETADGRVVVTHDKDLRRIAGVAKGIWAVTFDELRSYSAGAWFDPKFEAERVPTLEEMIDVAKGRIALNIEIKLNGHERNLVESVVHIIRERDFVSQCVVTSLSAAALEEVRRRAPEIRLGYIVFEAVGNLGAVDFNLLAIRASIASRTLLFRAHANDTEVHVWTVNDRRAMARFIDLGVDGILTDHPDVLHEVLAERRALSPQEKLLLAILRLWPGSQVVG